MTKYLTLIASNLFIILVNAQEYRSVLETSTFVQITKTDKFVDKKKAAYIGDDPFELGTATSMDSIVSTGKYKIIDNMEYLEYEPLHHVTYPDEYLTSFMGELYLRESVDKSKLYSREEYDENEMLIYDISLEKADTFNTRIFVLENEGVGFHVGYIDTALIVDVCFMLRDEK
jgi:hypothetical protein